MKKQSKKIAAKPAKAAKAATKKDEVAYEDAWYRALKAQAENRPHASDEETEPED